MPPRLIDALETGTAEDVVCALREYNVHLHHFVLASRRDNLSIFNALLAHRRYEQSFQLCVLEDLCKHNRIAAVARVLDVWFDGSANVTLNRFANPYYTRYGPLRVAVENRLHELAQLLLERGAAAEMNASSLLREAAHSCDLPMMHLLLKAGLTREADSVAERAYERGHAKIVDMLVPYGASGGSFAERRRRAHAALAKKYAIWCVALLALAQLTSLSLKFGLAFFVAWTVSPWSWRRL